MRALKGIRKGDKQKLKINLLIAFSWLMAVANRFHINSEKEVWRRFPYHCRYCGKAPCACGKNKSQIMSKLSKDKFKKPRNLGEMQVMFETIYPSGRRNLSEAGVHLAEEMGELSETVHRFLGEHKEKLFRGVGVEIADYISCLFGVANSASINVSRELEKMYWKNCHVCHKLPCLCNFSFVGKYKS